MVGEVRKFLKQKSMLGGGVKISIVGGGAGNMFHVGGGVKKFETKIDFGGGRGQN